MAKKKKKTTKSHKKKQKTVVKKIEKKKEIVEPQEPKVEVEKKPEKLFTKNYLLLWQGQLVSKFGTKIYLIAIILWLQENTGSKTIVSLFSASSSLPLVVMAILGGAVADRFSRKKIIVLSDFLSGVTMLLVASFFFFNPDYSILLLVFIFGLTIISSTTQAFFGPAISASIPDIVPEKRVAGANSMGKLSDSISMFFGTGLGSILYNAIGMPLVMIINGVSFIFSAISESFIKIPQRIPEKAKSFSKYIEVFKTDLNEGLAYIKKNRGLNRLLMLSIVTGFFAASIAALMVFYVKEFLGLDNEWFSIFLIISGIGSLIGSITAGILNLHGDTRKRLLLLFMLLEAVGYTFLVQVETATPALVLFTIGGFFSGFTVVNIFTIMQITIPSEIRGRVLGAMTTLSGSFQPLGIMIGGVTADIIGLKLVFIIAGSLMFLFVLIFSFNRDLRKLLAHQTAEQMAPTGFTYKIKTVDSDKINEQKEQYLEEQLKKSRSEL
ncbi:MAG: MFS transporter [Calditrichaeota bacterium]|nr:MFS transporter [Calditrichota bacterium]